MFEAGLVLEGGGMRGLFTAGVLDCFLEEGMSFSTCIGVSAGACHGVSYVCGQKGRARDVSLDYLGDRDYCGLYSLVTTGDLFNVKTVYETIPKQYYRLDADYYKNSPCTLYVTVTDCDSGEAEYIEMTDIYGQLDYVRASASLPLVSRRVSLAGKRYLDGGIADSIPIEKSLAMGNQKNVVVLTQDKSYCKSPDALYPLMRLRYRHSPDLVKRMKRRHLEYNRVLALLNQLEKEGRVYIIRPKNPVTIGRVEKDRGRLLALYHQGVKQAREQLPGLRAYLEKK